MAQRFEGRNLDEALDAASKGLGVERYQVSYGVVLEKRGFLGGTKRVVIEATINESAQPDPMQQQQPVAARPSFDAPRRSSGGGGERRPRRDRGESRGRGRDGRREGRDSRGPRREERQDRPAYDVRPPSGPIDAPLQGEQSAEAAAVAKWFMDLIDRAEFDLAVRTSEKEEAIEIRLYGEDTEKLLDRGGELLDSIQVISNKSLVGKATNKLIEVDCGDFKQHRVEELERKARELAEQVRANGGEQLLPAMTPIERRIVHMALRDDEAVETESRGDGFYKRIAIIPKRSVETSEAES